MLKKSPGLTNLKYSVPATTESGILPSVAIPLTIELKIFANKTPPVTATDVKRITFFYFNVLYQKMATKHPSNKDFVSCPADAKKA